MTDETIVVNLHRHTYDVYIGRAGKGRDGYFGNPFELGKDGGRAEVIKKYKAWFWNRVNTDAEFCRRAKELKGKHLGCFCKPFDCHGDVLKAWLDAGCPLKDKPETTMLSINGETFRCTCGGNVFTKKQVQGRTIYECNGCLDVYQPEEEL